MKKLIIACQILKDALINFFSRADVYYIVENADWSIKHDGISITRNLKNKKTRLTITHYGIRNSIVHYGSINTFFTCKKLKRAHSSNKIVVTWFHISPDDKRIEFIPNVERYVDIWHTSCSMTSEKLVNLGIKKEKIKIIPLGVDADKFRPLQKKQQFKKKQLHIGSFQKDGEGWGEGYIPKYIKGPDLLVEAIEHVNKKYELFVILTGPARGFVKRLLDQKKIRYEHNFLKKPNDVAAYYNKIDYYFVTSREEGGPKSVLESLASGVPLITTSVGMVPDIIIDGVNGFIVTDSSEYLDKVMLLENNEELKNTIIKNGLNTIKSYSWSQMAERYEIEIYNIL